MGQREKEIKVKSQGRRRRKQSPFTAPVSILYHKKGIKRNKGKRKGNRKGRVVKGKRRWKDL